VKSCPAHYVGIHEEKTTGVADEWRNQALDYRQIKRDGYRPYHRSPKTAAPHWLRVSFASTFVLGAHAARIATAAIAALRSEFLYVRIGDDMLRYDRNAGQYNKNCCDDDPDVYWDPNDTVNVHSW
jgi:hypothetical protein